MTRRNWKRIQPTSLRHALELCKEHAQARLNLSVERIAERMGLEDHWSLYKYMQNGRMPAVLIPAYEAACGIDYVTRWLASRDGKLLIEVPAGRDIDAKDLNALNQALHSAVGVLMAFYDNKKPAEAALAEITNAMESLAWHRRNVEQYNHPQLDFGGSDE